MKKTRSILIGLAAVCAMIGVICGFYSKFQKVFEIKKEKETAYPSETVYYAGEEPLDVGSASVQIILKAPDAAQSTAEETQAAFTVIPEETAALTVPETAEETAGEGQDETAPETMPTETVPETTASAWKKEDGVPNYYETDYPDIRFMTGSFAEYGSGVTSAAMVATYLTGYEYKPDQLAKWFSSYMGNQIQILEHISDCLRLPWYRAENFHIARQALKEGKVVIALMGTKSLFTTGQHFIVLTGLNDAGKITVNDPNRKNYDVWNLKNGFEEGFRDGEILAGYSAAWIYDPEQVSEGHFRYEDPAPAGERRYPELSFTEQETELLAKVIYEEVQDQPFERQQALAEVVIHRVVSGEFPNDLNGVLYQPGQFVGVNRLYAAKPTHVQYEAVRRALEGPYVLDEDIVFYSDVK